MTFSTIRIFLQNRIWLIGFRVTSSFFQVVISENEPKLPGSVEKYVEKSPYPIKLQESQSMCQLLYDKPKYIALWILTTIECWQLQKMYAIYELTISVRLPTICVIQNLHKWRRLERSGQNQTKTRHE